MGVHPSEMELDRLKGERNTESSSWPDTDQPEAMHPKQTFACMHKHSMYATATLDRQKKGDFNPHLSVLI